jgi:bifunctional DNA-binding transcriptional regulator/antitoxin component of YhaV-PrlF toxin-antitoxin module
MSQIRARVFEGGRIELPEAYRRALGIEVGDEIVIRLEGDASRLLTRRQAIRDAQATIRRFVPAGRSLVDELIEERRRETE